MIRTTSVNITVIRSIQANIYNTDSSRYILSVGSRHCLCPEAMARMSKGRGLRGLRCLISSLRNLEKSRLPETENMYRGGATCAETRGLVMAPSYHALDVMS